jgi:integrase
MKSTINSTTGVLRFAFKDPIKNLEGSKKKESLIFLNFSYSGHRFKYSTGYKACFENWDFDKQRIKEGKSKIINSREVNEYLSNIDTATKKEYSRLIAEQIVVTNDVLKSFLDGYLNKNIVIEKKKPVVFFDFAEKILNEKKKDRSIITIRSYKQTILKVKNFGLYNAEKIDFNSFDREFSINFINYLEELDFALNTITKHLKNLKTFLREADRMNLIDNKDFNIGYFTLKAEETTAIYLTDEELVKMFVLDLSKDSELELARDIFLIGCYTGQRVSDYNGLTKESIRTINGVNYFKIKQKKTKATVQCPITKEIREIMDKRHGGLPPKKILPQHLNIHIKAIGLLLEFEENIEFVMTKGGKEIKEYIPKYKLIHSHTARRSFCTNMYKKEMPIFDIMHFSGHKSEREFYKYIRIEGEERASHIVGKGFFNI